jgi:hypothetical protein
MDATIFKQRSLLIVQLDSTPRTRRQIADTPSTLRLHISSKPLNAA